MTHFFKTSHAHIRPNLSSQIELSRKIRRGFNEDLFIGCSGRKLAVIAFYYLTGVKGIQVSLLEKAHNKHCGALICLPFPPDLLAELAFAQWCVQSSRYTALCPAPELLEIKFTGLEGLSRILDDTSPLFPLSQENL